MKLYWQISKSFCLLYMLLLSGCLILPYPATFTPAVVGRVHRHGQPVESAQVSVVRYEPCEEAKPGVQTNTEGKFNLRRTKKVRWVWAMDPYHGVAVCIRDGDRRYTGWAESGLGYTPASLSLDCDLENNISIRTTAGLACVIYTRREPKRKSDKTLQTFRVRIPRSEGSLGVV